MSQAFMSGTQSRERHPQSMQRFPTPARQRPKRQCSKIVMLQEKDLHRRITTKYHQQQYNLCDNFQAVT